MEYLLNQEILQILHRVQSTIETVLRRNKPIFSVNDYLLSEMCIRDRVNIAFIGIGQRGGEIAKELYNTGLCNVVALCDVDMGAPHTQEIINMFPKAARFQDFRTMFDRMADKIDAVSVGVPDHSHFPITIEARCV